MAIDVKNKSCDVALVSPAQASLDFEDSGLRQKFQEPKSMF